MASTQSIGRKPRVVVVGAGFAGLAAVQALSRTAVDITLVDRRNYHLFQPLLYQVATAALSPADIAWPIRSILRRQRNVAVQMGRVTGIDVGARTVVVDDCRQIPFDYLVVAPGARHAYFGNDDWETVAPGIKKIDDATLIRQRLLTAFERAEVTVDADERRRLLTFVVVGGGPTGVELAGAVAELARKTLLRDFRAIQPGTSRVMLIEAGPRLLPNLPDRLSRKAESALLRLGVELRLGAAVTRCGSDGVVVAGRPIPARTVIWAAGVMASPAARWLGADSDRAGRVIVATDLSLPGYADIFVIGDTAHVAGPDGKPVPGTAPAAKQMGHHVALVIGKRIRGSQTPMPFVYRHPGSMATIGRKAAVVELGGIRLSGLPAWLLWAVTHIYFLIGWRNRLLVALNWSWSYVTFQRGARLITGSENDPADVQASTSAERRPAA